MKKLFPLLFLLAATPAFADCDENGAIAAAKAAPEIIKFCASPQYHGCDYKAVLAPVKTKPDAKWNVTASIIHSFDEKGQPRFMPEGFLFAAVTDDCKVTRVYGMGGEVKPQ